MPPSGGGKISADEARAETVKTAGGPWWEPHHRLDAPPGYSLNPRAVRYKIGDNGFASLAHLLEQGGAASAVTLIDVVVFRGPSEAADLSTWAHELTHVDQYRDWGVHSFAVQYARNWRSVEDPAYAKGNGYQAWADSTGTVGQFGGNIGAPAPNQVVMGNRCVTYRGWVLGPYHPVGSPCHVDGPWGSDPGTVMQ